MRRGDESLTEPQWMRTVFLWVMLLRELMNVILRVLAKKRKCELENQKSHRTNSLQQHSDFKHD
ncbi:hypothetical protein Hanom_Chr02g00102681 [Helianthus anomalus]